jgi:hypothetical protein
MYSCLLQFALDEYVLFLDDHVLFLEDRMFLDRFVLFIMSGSILRLPDLAWLA